MKRPYFFDSWGWIAVVDRKDPYHETAKSLLIHFYNDSGAMFMLRFHRRKLVGGYLWQR